MGSGFAKKKKQMRALQEQFSKMQDDLANKEVKGSAGNGLVTIKLNGENQLIDIKIKPECIDPDDIDGLEDLIKVAHANATEKLKSDSDGQMPDLSSLGF